MQEKPKCNRWLLLSLYFVISFGACGLVGSFTAILPLLRKACVFANFCRCDPTTVAYRGVDCLNPELRNSILFEPLSKNDDCNPLGCDEQNTLHTEAWKMGLSVPLIASPIAGTISDVIGPRALGTIGALFICFGLSIWLLLTSALNILSVGKYLLGLSWLLLGVGRVCISYSIVSVSSLFKMQSLVISILGGLIDAAIVLPMLFGYFQININEKITIGASNYIENRSNRERCFIYMYLVLSVFSLFTLFFTLPTVTFDKLKKTERKLNSTKQFILCENEMMEGGFVKHDLDKVENSNSRENLHLSCPKKKQSRTRSEITNVKVRISSSQNGNEQESTAICNLKASSAIMGGYSVVCSLAKCKYLLRYDKNRSHSSPLNASNCNNDQLNNSSNEISVSSLRSQLLTYEYFTFMALFIFNFWRCSVLVSKSEYIVSSSIISSFPDIELDKKLPQTMNIYNIVMSLGSIFSVVWGAIATKYGVNFMILLITILACLIHSLLILNPILPFWFIYIYFGAFSALRSFIFGSLNCFIGDTFGFSNFARLAGIQAFTCFVFFQAMNRLTSRYFDSINLTMINVYLLIPSMLLILVPIILFFFKKKRKVVN
ncbi:hypothetical protein RS030_71049 [Cryptosporidium xiaoi]|uniref:Uncharacterized protein n=1 Tax=Cryptosporidium xiaoi TaxID=659607 RepID=A0AAV9XVE4_9CRYT